ncbi:MAG: flavodoxin family protein [Nanoarchaeota archaeon]
MSEKRVLLVCQSIHHGNTIKIAKAIAEVLNAEIITPSEINSVNLGKYSLIGMGSGIYWGKHHQSILKLADKMPTLKNKRIFIFSTSGISNAFNLFLNITNLAFHFHTSLRRKLKDAVIVGEFNCKGFDTYGILKFSGGVSKGRPNEMDLKRAKSFAENLKHSLK